MTAMQVQQAETGEAARPMAVEVRGLSHTYPGAGRRRGKDGAGKARRALREVSFAVGSGEIFGILGPNGGGKTTLFKVLATLLRPSGEETGEARVFGRDVLAEPAAVRGSFGIVFQNPSLDVKLTAEENLTHQGHLYGLSGVELRKRITYWLGEFDLRERRHERVERFSGGMRRRVELAKALLHEPRLLLMDEPATGLDPAARRQLWDHLERLRRERGMTIVLTTHLMEEAERCDRLAILQGGRLIALDEPGRLKGQLGGDVVTLELGEQTPAGEARKLVALIEREFGPWEPAGGPMLLEDGQVRFETRGGAEVVAQIARRWDGRLKRVTVGQPTLEDVFLHLTGERFEG